MGRLEWNRSVERDRSVLERILVSLLALAVLADRADGLPLLKRLQLLAVLEGGEAEARRFILAMAPGSPAEPGAWPPLAASGAARLGARFRILAFALNGLMARVHESPPCPRALLPTGAPKRRRCRRAGWLAFPVPAAPDTS